MVFSRSNWTPPSITLNINGINIDQVDKFNFLGLTISQDLSWKSHVCVISSKLSKTLGVMCRIKSFVPSYILTQIYFTMFHSHLNFQILAWGHEGSDLFLLQKRALRIINNEHFLAHTDPLFKARSILKFDDMYILAMLKFYHRYSNGLLPEYFNIMQFDKNSDMHDHNTRHANDFRTPSSQHRYGEKNYS